MKDITYTNLRISTKFCVIRKLLCKKGILKKELQEARCECIDLLKLTDYSDARVYVLLGKIDYLLKDYERAYTSFSEAIMVNPNLAASYYGLFKIYMNEENYDKALNAIDIYSKITKIDVDLYKKLLNIVSGNKDSIVISNTDNILGNKVKYKPLMDNYNMCINFINNGEYGRATKHLNVCIKLIGRMGYNIDLSMIKSILVKLSLHEYEVSKNKVVYELKDSFIIENNLGKNYYLLLELHKYEPYNINILLLLIDISLQFVNFEEAKRFLDKAKKIPNNVQERLDYYETVINGCMSSVDYLSYAKAINEIISMVNSGLLDEAGKYAYDQFKNTDNDSFIYIIGELIFQNGLYEQAELILRSYLLIGKSFVKETYYYLFIINYLKGEMDEADYYLALAYKLSKFEGEYPDISEFRKHVLRYKDDFSSKKIAKIEKDILGHIIEEKNKVLLFK